jgi:hypothetical protein
MTRHDLQAPRHRRPAARHPRQGLKAGDLGVVVHVDPRGGLEVEFARAKGATQAVVTLESGDLRSPTTDDHLAVRPSGRRV